MIRSQLRSAILVGLCGLLIVMTMTDFLGAAEGTDSGRGELYKGHWISQVFENMANSVTTIDAVVRRPRTATQQARTVRLTWDIHNNYYTVSTALDVGDSLPSLIEMGRNEKQEWFGTEMRTRGVPDGCYSYELHRPGSSPVPGGILQTNSSMKFVRHLFTPVHVEEMANISQEEIDRADVRVTVKERPDGHSLFTLSSYEEGKLCLTCEYDMVIDKGPKIYSMTSTYHGGDSPLVDIKQEFSRHENVNGVWLPMSMVETWHDEHGKVSQEVTLELDEVSVNMPLGPEEFQFDPPDGSLVHDNVLDVMYSVGSKAIDERQDVVDNLIEQVGQHDPTVMSSHTASGKGALSAQSVGHAEMHDKPSTDREDVHVAEQAPSRYLVVGSVIAIIAASLILGFLAKRRSTRRQI